MIVESHSRVVRYRHIGLPLLSLTLIRIVSECHSLPRQNILTCLKVWNHQGAIMKRAKEPRKYMLEGGNRWKGSLTWLSCRRRGFKFCV